jgi:hypothetical protein
MFFSHQWAHNYLEGRPAQTEKQRAFLANYTHGRENIDVMQLEMELLKQHGWLNISTKINSLLHTTASRRVQRR